MFESVARLIDPAALLLVGAGSLTAAALRSTRGDLLLAIKALRPMVSASPARDELVARRAVRQIEQIAEIKGIASADHVDTKSSFVRRAALTLADAPSPEAFAAWSVEELSRREARHRAAAAVWRAAAEASPNMGMIGTVLGLIAMFASMDDPARMGPAMALAMLTTLYGLIFGAAIFGPAAARLERLSLAELSWQRTALARLQVLASGEVQSTEAWLKRHKKTAG